MHNLIYFNSDFLRRYDTRLENKDYKHGHWFRLHNCIMWAVHTQCRVTQLDTPWNLAPSLCPIPTITKNETRFDIVLDSIAEEFGQQVAKSDKPVYICWSGGVDSTSILVSILKTWSKSLLDRVIVLCDELSQQENPYFYHRFIKDQFTVRPMSWLSINHTNFDKIFLLDGEAGNQILNGTSVQKLCYSQRFDLLNEPWRNRKDLSEILIGANNFNIELIQESICHAPIDIVTGYDFLWWTGFNMKMQDVLLRKMFVYAKDLTPAQTQILWSSGVYRFYQHDKMQIWSMLTCNQRRENLATTVKYHAKKYIYDFDQNDFYWQNKTEQGSTSQNYLNYQQAYWNRTPVFAMDANWNKYTIKDPTTRHQLGKILNMT